MEILPSKELLSAVLGYPITASEGVSFNVLSFRADLEGIEIHGEQLRAINIYELMHLMKEWAIKNEHELMSCGGGYCESYPKSWDSLTKPIKEFYGDTEFEAVTKAAEWIKEQLKC